MKSPTIQSAASAAPSSTAMAKVDAFLAVDLALDNRAIAGG
jgi:hypothetical protein